MENYLQTEPYYMNNAVNLQSVHIRKMYLRREKVPVYRTARTVTKKGTACWSPL